MLEVHYLGSLGSPWLGLLLRLALASVFLMAAATKLPERRAFASNVDKYGIVPRPLATAYGVSLPWLELAGALILVVGWYAWAGAALLAVLLTTFIVAVATAIRRRLDLDCSCFGLLYRERISAGVLVRDGILLMAALLIILLDHGKLALHRMAADLPGRDATVGLTLTALALVVSTALSLLAVVRANSLHATTPASGPPRYPPTSPVPGS